MSAISRRKPRTRSAPSPRHDDPRVVRSRAAVVEAATTLFLQKGYGGTTMEDIADVAGIARRTLYNNYADKSALFVHIVSDALAYAEEFAANVRAEFSATLSPSEVPAALHAFGRKLAVGILRPEVIALRRLLIGEARVFPELARDYFDRAPGRVISALATSFEHWHGAGLLHASDARRAAEQFAYLVVGAPLDRAVLVGTTPTREQLLNCAREGVETFIARYASGPATRRGASRVRGK